MAGWPDAVVLAVVVGAVLWHVRARRRWRRRTVLLALRSADPEIRRAAVLVAICDGARNHLRPLSDRTRDETDETVLDALALVAEEGGTKLGRRRRASQLRTWAEARLSSRAPAAEANPARSIPPPANLHLIDALELIERLTSVALVDSSSRPLPEPVSGRWRTPVRHIDALEVVDVVARCTPDPAPGDAPTRRRTAARGLWRAGPDGIDALLASDLTGHDDGRRPARRRTRERTAASA
ncbi:MAG TPA: hypothetical protein VHH09_09115 [Acidimicrobiales bacterium]|nr:hypothetical protein [Acidimicrobiales bacterium]